MNGIRFGTLFRVCALCAALTLSAPRAGAQTRSGRSQSVVNIDGARYWVHTVAAGETLYSLSRLYDVPQEDIVRDNPHAAEGLRAEQVLKIEVVEKGRQPSERRMARIFERHTVLKGETAYSISKHYGISVPTLMEDNPGLDPAVLATGQQINVRRAEMGEHDGAQIDSQWEQYASALNSVTDDGSYHKVLPGETLYSLARRFGVAREDIERSNAIEPSGLKAGMLIKIPEGVAPTSAADTMKVKVPIGEPRPVTRRRDRVGEMLDGLFGPPEQTDEPRRFEGGEVRVALMLPLQGTQTGRGFLEFYQGALIAMQDLKALGVEARLDLYDTEKSVEKVRREVSSQDFEATDIIIGPVYEDELQPALDFARERCVPVVSPLAQLEDVASPLLYQLSPDPAARNDKLRAVLSPGASVVVVSSARNDAGLESAVAGLLPAGHRRFDYSKGVSTSSIESLVRGDQPVVMVVLAADEHEVESVLARVSSVRANLTARGGKVAPITVVGSSDWLRFQNLDRNLYFKLGACMTTNYHADRNDPRVNAFSRRYTAAFSALPTLYSFRGYDAVKLFVGTYVRQGAERLQTALNLSSEPLLQMPYHFSQTTRTSTHVNGEWALVRYKSDYTIEVE